ncbi:putative NADP(+)-dependent dehydrogenase [Aureobasidium pullulans]|nr:putative NADP(+)-dependent dehydrogenase [Aureobasidium pullulans]
MTYNILISGTTKGLGRALVEKYLGRPNTLVVATVRDPSTSEATSLQDLPKAEGSDLIVVKIEARSDTDGLEAVNTISSKLSHLDLVIANSGFYTVPAAPQIAKIAPSDLLDHVNVNTAGTIRLFQATLPLLQKAKEPIFAYISSMAGSIALTGDLPFPTGIYGASKAAMNFLVRRIHQEHPELISVALHPGAVMTPGGTVASKDLGMDNPDFAGFYTTLEKSIDGMVGKLDNASREETSGKFLSFDDERLEW